MEKLWEPVTIGNLTLPNRLAMAAMTRNRSTPAGVPTAINAQYYAQRASVGLVIAEGTQPSDDGQGYLLTPGIYTEQHIAGWKLVTDAVHAAGGRMFIQLMHVGRIAHPDNTPHGRRPVGASEVQPAGQMFTAKGPQPMPVPRELSTNEIADTVRDYRRAAAAAIAAGAEGIELHGANGYLIHQFLSENANRRTDAYGGSLENRVRFAVDVAAGVADEIGADRVGIRISPANPFNDIVEGDTAGLYRTLIAKLAPLRLAYLHVMHTGNEELLRYFRSAWPTSLLVNRPGRPREDVAIDVDSGMADVATVATFALPNPDLVTRLKHGAPLNEPDTASFYGGTERGYTDYPALSPAVATPSR